MPKMSIDTIVQWLRLPGVGMVVSQSPHLIRWKGEVEADMNMKKTISIALLCGTAALTWPASSQPSETTAYHYVLPLTLALEAATEAVRACAQNGYLVSATVVDMDGVPLGTWTRLGGSI